jgi:hypothetical protein
VEKIVDCLGKRIHSEANSQLAKKQPILVHLSSSLFSESNPAARQRCRQGGRVAAQSRNLGGFPQSPVKIS